MSKADAQRRDRRQKAIAAGWDVVSENLALNPLARTAFIHWGNSLHEADGWAVVDQHGCVTVNPERDGEPIEWAWVFAHLLLHLGLGHLDDREVIDPAYATACCVAVHRFAEAVRIGRAPFLVPALPGGEEQSLAERWRLTGIPADLADIGSAQMCIRLAPEEEACQPLSESWTSRFARGLTYAASDAMTKAAEARGQTTHQRRRAEWDHAMSWFVSSYPLLGAMAAGFTLVPDQEIARAWDISIAAVSPDHGEIYINPHAGLSTEEWRFVLAHEMLHAALRHDRRADGRDPYLWNVACDYVINGWLVVMAVGHIPESSLYDQKLTGLSAESVYDTLTTDLRRARKLRTLGSRSAGDVLGDWLSEPEAARRRSSRRVALPWEIGDRARLVDLDEFYRRSLTQGLEYHRSAERGDVPLGLEEEIRALDHPPLPWDAQLAQWFDEHVRAAEPRRGYARASRRQAASPDIPRPGRLRPEELTKRPTFGVVLDTSGSMDTNLLGKALGAIASYASARDVPAARVVFCDAVAYDAGYLAVDQIAGTVKVRGRGGTMLQPGVTLLERAADFPADGPILVITDAECDVVRVRREHAFLVPAGARLPFTPKGPVFRVR
ncbi:hypothetical protein [Actinocrispum sp. NPDC049592]|uniref:vWA domain-containing protein n=1 Tax=Actinocrispum sp. NPDC049592 TaxID=3154835 RepID=UPI0034414428